MKELLKKLTKILNNFKLTARIIACLGILAVVLDVLLFVFYQFSGGQVVEESGQVIQITAFNNQKILGMVYFLFCIVSVILGIAIVYMSFPYCFPKDKMTPSKALPWMCVADAVLHLPTMVFVIMILATEDSQMKVGFIIALILGFLFIVCAGLMAYPALKCRFYMPALVQKEEKK